MEAPPEIVVIVDADCIVEAGSLERLARTCLSTNRPVQALYLMKSPPDAGLKTKIAEFAWAVKDWARPLGLLAIRFALPINGHRHGFSLGVVTDCKFSHWAHR